MSRATSAQWGVPCPPAPDGCGAAADAPCRANGGTGRVTETHKARMLAWGAIGKPKGPAVGVTVGERAADAWWLGLSTSRRMQIHAWVAAGDARPEPDTGQLSLDDLAAS